MARAWIRRSTIATALALAVAAPADAARVTYQLDAGIEHDDNIRLDAVDADSERIWRAGLGFLVTEETSVVQARVGGRLEYRDPQDGAYSSTVEGILSAYLNWVLVSDRLSLTVQDELELQPVDRYAPDGPDNRQQVNVLSLGPDLLFDFGPTLQGRAEARATDTHAEITDAFNSRRHSAALRLTKAFGATSSVSVNGQWQDVDYDDDLAARDHDRSDLYGRYERTMANSSLGLDVGYSRIDYDDGASNDNPLVRLEYAWRPGGRGRLSLLALSQFSDAADSALSGEGFDAPGAGVPGGVLSDGAAITPSVYRERRIALAWDHVGERTTWRVEPYVQRLRYLDAVDPDEDALGVMVGLDHRVTPTLSLNVWADIERTDYDALDATDDTRRLGVSLEKRWTPRWSTALSVYRYERDSGVLDNEVRQNVAYLWVSYRNRPL